MDVTMVPFVADRHLAQTLAVLQRVRDVDPTYPPPVDVGTDDASLTSWLLDDAVIGRWVTLSDGVVSGHVTLVEPHAYLTRFLSSVGHVPPGASRSVEIAKFFVDPARRGVGLGSGLFAAVCASAWGMGRQPSLAVVESSVAARRLYERSGMKELGSFVGIHGVNHVFVQDEPGSPGRAA